MSKGLDHPPWLRDALELSAKKGMDRGRLLLEGLRLNRAARGAGASFEQILVAPEFYDDGCRELVGELAKAGVPVHEVPSPTFSKLSYKAEGIIGIVRFVPRSLKDVLAAEVVIVLDALSDPGNIGAILRSANAWEASAVVVDDGRRLFHPKALRASMGALFDTPSCRAERGTLIAALTGLGRKIVVLDPEGTCRIDALAANEPLVIVLGNEKRGVHEEWRGLSLGVSIPTGGVVDSLNVATAAAIALWETYRRREPAR